MDIKAKIEEILAALQSEGQTFYVVEIAVSGSRNRPKLTILLDSDAGITIDECAEVSRELGQRFDEHNIIDNAYTLEVSSPGIDYPLNLNRQYIKNIGRSLKVVLIDGTEKIGKLETVTDEAITLVETRKKGTKKKEAEPIASIHIPFAQMKKAQVQVSFK